MVLFVCFLKITFISIKIETLFIYISLHTAFWHNKAKKEQIYLQAMNKTVSERWWDLYLNDDGCKKNFNGLHLVCSMYGDGEDSDTVMQSMARDYHNQLFPLEFIKTDSQFKESLSSCMWNDQYPEGFFARLQSELPDIRVISGIRKRVQIFAPGGKRQQTWEEWGRNIIRMDDEAKADKMPVWISGKKLRKILTEQQRTELEKRLKHYRGERYYEIHNFWGGHYIKRRFDVSC